MTLLRLFGNALAGFLDFSAGTFIIFAAANLTNHDVSPLHYFLGGILAAGPDIDILYMIIKKGRAYGDHHQNLTHRPLVILPLAALAGFPAGGQFWAVGAAVCLLWHYLHDTEGLGGSGIAWLWPFSRKYISPKRIVDPEHSQAAEFKDRYYEYIDNFWLKPTNAAVLETAIGVLLLSAVITDIAGPQLSIAAAVAILTAVWLIWLISSRTKTR